MEESMSDDLPKCSECGQPLHPGATGKFPHGQLNPDDQGELRTVIGLVKDKLVMQFGKPVPWVAMTKEDVIQLASVLFMWARKMP